jgi:hypothetical protein
MEDIRFAQRQLAISLHHDSITGTSYNKTISDFLERLDQAETKLQHIVEYAFDILSTKHVKLPKEYISKDH